MINTYLLKCLHDLHTKPRTKIFGFIVEEYQYHGVILVDIKYVASYCVML